MCTLDIALVSQVSIKSQRALRGINGPILAAGRKLHFSFLYNSLAASSRRRRRYCCCCCKLEWRSAQILLKKPRTLLNESPPRVWESKREKFSFLARSCYRCLRSAELRSSSKQLTFTSSNRVASLFS